MGSLSEIQQFFLAFALAFFGLEMEEANEPRMHGKN